MLKATKNWIINHDNSKYFAIFYIGLSVILSVWLGLFWLIFFVSIHFLFELIKFSFTEKNALIIFLKSFDATKLDVVLVLFALCLAVYIDFLFGIVGIGAGSRAIAQTGQSITRSGTKIAGDGVKTLQSASRMIVYQKVIRSILITIDDVGLIIKAIFTSKNLKKKANSKNHNTIDDEKQEEKDNSKNTKSNRYKKADYLIVFAGLVFVILILFAPIIIGINYTDLFDIIITELKPLPE